MASYIFPKNLTDYTLYMTLKFYQYRVPIGGGQSGQGLVNELGTIRLPLPNSMVDHQDVVYAAENLGLIAGAALAKWQSSGKELSGLAAGIGTGVAADAAKNLAGAIPTGGTASAADILLQTQGLAVNPFLSVMFKSPAFKKHAFKWLLTPTHDSESRELDGIVKYIRYNQLPSRSAAFGGTVLAYPNIVVVSVSNSTPPDIGNSDSYWSYTFKPAVIESFAANYTPAGQASHFAGRGAPTMAEISMSLLEIEYWLQEDYGNASTTGSASTFASDGSISSLFKSLVPSTGSANETIPNTLKDAPGSNG